MAILESNVAAVRAIPFLKGELSEVGVVANDAKTVALPPLGHTPTAKKVALLVGVRDENH